MTTGARTSRVTTLFSFIKRTRTPGLMAIGQDIMPMRVLMIET